MSYFITRTKQTEKNREETGTCLSSVAASDTQMSFFFFEDRWKINKINCYIYQTRGEGVYAQSKRENKGNIISQITVNSLNVFSIVKKSNPYFLHYKHL